MAFKYSTLLTIAALALYIQNGNALQCHFCSTLLDSNCGDTFTATDTLQDNDLCLACTKSKSKTSGYVDSETITRGCQYTAASDSDLTCHHNELSLFGQTTETWNCVCDTDGCNHAGKVTVSFIAILSVLLAIYVL